MKSMYFIFFVALLSTFYKINNTSVPHVIPKGSRASIKTIFSTDLIFFNTGVGYGTEEGKSSRQAFAPGPLFTRNSVIVVFVKAFIIAASKVVRAAIIVMSSKAMHQENNKE